MRVDTDPAGVRLAGQDYSGAARAGEAGAVRVEACASPGGDHDGHGGTGAGEYVGVGEVESEAPRAGPDIIPLSGGPSGEASDQFLLGAEENDLGMPKRPGSSVVDVAHAGGEAREPIVDGRSDIRVGDGEAEWFYRRGDLPA